MDFLMNAKKLPFLDWNLTFFGAHEQTVDSGWKVPPDKHYAFECIYVFHGVESVQLQQSVLRLTSGDLCIIPPEFLHQVWAEGHLTYFCFHFDIDDPKLKIQLIKGLDYRYSINSELCAKVRPHLEILDSLIARGDFSFDTKMTIQIELSKMLQLFYHETKAASETQSLTSTEYARVIADYLKDEVVNQILFFSKEGVLDKSISISVAAAIQKAGFSNGYGFRIFKKAYGISPREYLSRLKINEAKKLLSKPQYSIDDIGTALGYKDPASFSRQFKRWTEISPGQFRKNQLRAIDR